MVVKGVEIKWKKQEENYLLMNNVVQFLPVFKAVTVLSLFMGILFGFEVPQILTDAIHYGESERKAQSFTSSPLLNFFSKNSP